MNWDDIDQRFPWQARTYHTYTAVEPWLRDHVGEFDREWYRYGTDIAQGIIAGGPFYDTYLFRDERYAILFKLKWT